MASNFTVEGDALTVVRRRLSEGLETGFSRAPTEERTDGPVLADFARVMRGIATGANEFFFLTSERAAELGIPDELLIPAVGRTRDVEGDEITDEDIESLEARGRPTRLFSPDGRPIDYFPQTVREYLKRGESLGLH